MEHYVWHSGFGRSGKYLGTRIDGRTVLLHRFIYSEKFGPIPDGMEIDHADQNPLNNSLENLRLVTRSINAANRPKQKNNTSGFKGVHRYSPYNKWKAVIKKNRRQIFLGYFDDKIEAARAVNAAYKSHFPEVATPNEV